MYTEKYCRLCALKFPITALRNIEELKNDKQLTSSVLQYLQLRITDNDRLPHTFCLHCCQTLADLNRFRINVIDAQKKLENLIYYTDNQFEQHDTKPSKLDLSTFSQDIPDNDSTGGNDYVNDLDTIDQLINDFKSESGQECDDVASDRGSDHQIDKKPENLEIFWQDTLKTDKEEPEPINIDNNILNNALTILKNLRFKCYKCNTWLKTETCLQDHFDTEHDAKMKYVCPKCKTLFINLNDFKKHLYGHYLQKIDKKLRFTCEICGKKFESESILNAHKDFHLDQNAFSCNECGRKFRSKEKLTEHEFIHKENKDNIYPNDKLFKCHQCGKSCINEYILKRHLLTHVPKELKNNFQCDICDRKFLNAINLKNHQVLHRSSNNDKHICDECGRVFKSKVNMLEHKVTHTNARPYKCDECAKTFKSDRVLLRHKLTHNDEKLFGCEICGKKFSNKLRLNDHGKVHSDELPFECEFCKKLFKRKSYLKVHLRQHTGERPYSCTECNLHFTNSANYGKHLKRKHGLRKFSISNKPVYPFDLSI